MANENNLKPIQTESEAREKGRQGGIASGKARRERKTLADTLRVVLEEKANDAGLTRREAIVARVVKRLYDKGDVYQLKALADILGESEETLHIKGVAPIVAKDAEDAAALQRLFDGLQKKKDGTSAE